MANLKKNVDEFGRPLLRIGEAADYLGVGAATIRAYSDEGRLAYTRSSDRPNAQRLYKIADLERFGRENHIRRRKATIETLDFDSMSDDDEVGIGQAAKYLRISSMTIRNYARNHEIPYTRSGGRNAMMFKKRDLDAFAAAHADMRRRVRRRPDSPKNFDFSFDASNMAVLFMSIHDKNRVEEAIGKLLTAGYADDARYVKMTEVSLSANGKTTASDIYRVECDVPMPSIKDAVALVTKSIDISCDHITYKHDASIPDDNDADNDANHDVDTDVENA